MKDGRGLRARIDGVQKGGRMRKEWEIEYYTEPSFSCGTEKDTAGGGGERDN